MLKLSLIGFIMAGCNLCGAAEGWVRFSDNGTRVVIEANGIESFEGLSSAVYELDGNNHRVGTKGFKVLSAPFETLCSTVFGDAVLTTAVYGKDDSPFKYTLKLKRLKNLRAFTLQGVFHNHSDGDVKLRSFDLLDASKSGGTFAVANAADWLVTPLMEDSDALPLSEMNKSLNEVAMIRHKSGNGFLVGPVGPAEAYTTVEVRDSALKAWVQMDNVLVRAGESRRSEEIIVCFEPSSTAADIWTRWVAATHGVRRNKGAVYGWCSWYDRTTKIDAAHVLSVTQTIEAHPDTFGRGIIQIDDGYQKMDGNWSANEKFPEGMAAIAKRIRAAGCIPGIWFAPLMMNPEHPWGKQHPDAIQKNAQGIASFMNANSFHPEGANWINPDHPESKKFLYNIISDARARGYGYIKIDFNGIGSRFVDPAKTRLQVFRELYALYRDAAGDEMYILSCLGQPTRGVIGFIDAARVGPDSHPAHFNKCLKSVLRFQIYDNVWWHNDPDVAYLAQRLGSRTLGPTPQGEGMWRTWHSTVALVGGTAMISEPVNKPDCKEVWRNYEIMRPSSREPARLLTLGQSGDNSIFGFAAQRPYGDFAVYNLYNSIEGTRALTLDFKVAGLPTGVKCAVFDFWSNRVIGYTADSYTTVALEQYSSALLRFTPLNSDRPTLVGSDLHLSIGATEVDNLRISPSVVVADLSDAGAQAGSLTFYSENPLGIAGSENCNVTSVVSPGDNLWQVNITGRKWGKAQSISLTIIK
ncbi:MAG: alpha-galactosidase [Kiritimatiellae bacterium]|nr:alpha-galactosidase [Kiritimatiellia bacterium]